MKIIGRAAGIGLLVVGCAAAAQAQPSDANRTLQSPALAAELQTVLAEKGIDAIATTDPDAPDRFIAILAFPKVQLLAVAARPSSADYIKWQIGQKQYRQAYEQLQQSGLAEHRLFFQDMGADGLPAIGDDGVDVMYERGTQIVLDGAKKRGQEAAAYRDKLQAADAEYSRMLRLALTAARAHLSTASR